MWSHKIKKSLILILAILGLSACAENPNSSFSKVIRTFGGGQRITKVKEERSPIIHKDIYERSSKDKLIYFYQGKDTHNINFTRTLKEYADKAWLEVEAYTLDNHTLMEFPDTKFATLEVLDKYFGTADARFKTPVLFLEQFDAHAIPVSVGDISFTKLVNKMNAIAEYRQKR